MKKILITGATGFLGQFYIKDRLEKTDDKIYSITRSNGVSAQDRLDNIFGNGKVKSIEGNVASDKLGISDSDYDFIKNNVNEIWHFAGMTSFDERKAEKTIQTNYNGTQSIIDLAHECHKLDLLSHISTAYVCGFQKGFVLEDDLTEVHEFSNTYEKSKNMSERLVKHSGLPYVIFRPSVVVGDSQSGETACYNMVYAPWGLAEYLKSKSSKSHKDFSLKLMTTDDADLNVICVDDVVKIMSDLGNTENIGKTYHVTNPHPVKIHDLMSAAVDYLNLGNVELVSEMPEKTSREEEIFYRMIKPFEPYTMNKDPIFVQDNFNSDNYNISRIDSNVLETLLQYAVKDNWGRP